MRRFLGLLIIPLFLLAGCGTPEVVMQPVPIAGGKLVPIAFGPRGPIAGKANGFEVLYAASNPGAVATQLVYKFAFSAPPGTQLSRVIVDDISDEQNGRLVDDEKPWLDSDRWRTETKPYDSKDPLLAWVYTISHTMRVYRFTITDKAGKQTVLYQVTGYPAYIKAAIRATWGEKY